MCAHRPGRVKLKSAGARAPRTTAYFFFGGVVVEELLPEAGGVVLPLLLPELAPLLLPLVLPLPEVLLLPELAGASVLEPEEAGAAVLEEEVDEEAGAADWLDGCLAQAVRSTAAAIALRTTLVFI